MFWLIDHPLVFFVSTFVVLMAATRIGVVVRLRGHFQSTIERQEFDIVRAAMLTLLGLLVGFAISMAVSRYDLRKTMEEQEANAIGTEYARLELMPAGVTASARALLRSYTDLRIAFYLHRKLDQQQKIEAETVRTLDALWAAIAPEVEARPTAVAALVASGMNDVMNSQSYTLAAWRNRLPIEVWLLLILVATSCNVLIGVGAEKLSPATRAVLPATVALAFFLIADVESPRNGLVQIEPSNLEDVAALMNGK